MKKTNINRERERFEKRKAAGEPVIFYKNQCCFDAGIALAGYVPGPYPGLAYYTRKGCPVDPEMFAQWLKDTEHERKQLGLDPLRSIFDDYYGNEYTEKVLKSILAEYGITNGADYIKYMQQCLSEQVSYASTGTDFWGKFVGSGNKKA